MARRSDIDWEAIEKDYRAGVLTIAVIAKAHGVSDSQVRARAKKEGWARDLSDAIKARTKAKVSAIDVSALVEQSARESAQKSAALIRDAIEQAADVAAGVQMRHRADVRLDHERAQMLESLFDQHAGSAESIGDVVKAAQAFKNLIDSKSKLREQERVMYGLDDIKPMDGESSSIEVTFVDVGAGE